MLSFVSVVIKQQTTVTDKVKHRLEQLDDFEEVRNLKIKIIINNNYIENSCRYSLFQNAWRNEVVNTEAMRFLP